ncbi:class I adenylate-forming enzyme family protein [Desulfonauticus submarinus]
MDNAIREIQNTFAHYNERIFLIEAMTERYITYGNFYELACKAAYILQEHGISHKDRVALVLTNSAEFAAIYFGCMFLGAIAVPINPELQTQEINFIVMHAGVKLIVCSTSTKKLAVEALSNSPIKILCLKCLHEHQQKIVEDSSVFCVFDDVNLPNNRQPVAKVSDADLFLITFTSGTTGQPKGVTHRLSTLINSATSFNKALGFNPENRFYHLLPMAYMAGFLNTILCPFLAGASIVLDRKFDARMAITFWEAPIKYDVNTLWLVPSILAMLLRVDRSVSGKQYCRKHIDTVCVGTAPLPLKLKKDFEDKYGVNLLESYGLSETLFVATDTKYNRSPNGSVGRPLPNVELRVLDDEGKELPAGEEGEIWIRSPFIMAGYLNYDTLQPDNVNPNESFCSGDIGYLTPEGYLFVTGRKKEIIIKGGVNISPRAIEEVIFTHEGVSQCAVIGIPHDLYGEDIVAIIKLKDGYSFDLVCSDLKELCKKKLYYNAIPSKYIEITEFPVSITGKIQKMKLREQLVSL